MSFPALLHHVEYVASGPGSFRLPQLPVSCGLGTKVAAWLEDRLVSCGFADLTHLQQMVLSATLRRQDIHVLAEPCSGKSIAITLAFLALRAQTDEAWRGAVEPVGVGAVLPYCIILAPTREMVLHIESSIGFLANSFAQKVVALSSSSNIRKCISVSDCGCQILISQPTVLRDCLHADTVCLDRVLAIAYDAVDHQVVSLRSGELDQFITDNGLGAHPGRRTMMFTSSLHATWNFAARHTKACVTIKPGFSFQTTSLAEFIFEAVTPRSKFDHVLRKLHDLYDGSSDCPRLVLFCNATTRVHQLHARLMTHFARNTVILHGGLSAAQREQNLKAFQAGGTAYILVTTDISSRGLEIHGVDYVVMVDLPFELDVFENRVLLAAPCITRPRIICLVCVDCDGALAEPRNKSFYDDFPSFAMERGIALPELLKGACTPDDLLPGGTRSRHRRREGRLVGSSSSSMSFRSSVQMRPRAHVEAPWSSCIRGRAAARGRSRSRSSHESRDTCISRSSSRSLCFD